MSKLLYDPETERALLGYIEMHGAEAFEAALSAGLEAGHFYDPNHRAIYRAMFGLVSHEMPVDGLTLKAALEESGQLADVGIVNLSQLSDGVPLSLDVAHYARQIVKLAGERALLNATANLQAAANSGNGDLQAAIRDVSKALEAHESQAGEQSRHNLTGRIREYVEGIEGTFFTYQLCADLGITDPKGRACVRTILNRLKGTDIQAHGLQSGCWRTIRGDVEEMDLQNAEGEELDLWLPLDLHQYVTIMPGNEIIITGDPDAGKTAFLLRTIQRNLGKWDCHYFNSEMGALELRKRLNLFGDFPINHPHFHAYERGDSFQDVMVPGKYTLNVIDFLEINEEFYLIAKHLGDIYKTLRESVAVIAIQKKSRTCDLPLGAQRALEKPRLAISLSAGNRSEPNRATILKCKNRKTEHSMIGKTRPFKLIAGCEFRATSQSWD
jgi:hypothetical protein